MPWILFFFLGAGAVAAVAAGPSKTSKKPRFTEAGKVTTEGIKLAKLAAFKDPNLLKDLTAGSPYRLADVYAIGKRIIDYSFEFNGLTPPADVPFSDEGTAIRNAWTLEQYLGSILKRLRNQLDDYAGILPGGNFVFRKNDAELGRDEQTRARGILLNVIMPILAGRIFLGSHPSMQQTKNALDYTGNVGPIGSDRPFWNPWAPLRRYLNKDTQGGTLAQQDFVRSIVTWLAGYFISPGTACFYADAEGTPIVIPWGADYNTDAGAWKKGSQGWRYSREPALQSGVLNQLWVYFRLDLDLYCSKFPDAEPSPCDALKGLDLQWLQPASREQEARFLEAAEKAQVYAEGNLQRLDVLGSLVLSLYSPRAVTPFDWSLVIRIVLTAVAIVVQVAPGIGQAVGGVIAAGIAVTNAAIGFVKAAMIGGEDAQRMAMAFGAGIIDVLQKASLLTKGDLDFAKKAIDDARKVAGLAIEGYDKIQQGNFGGAYADGKAAVAGTKNVANDVKSKIDKAGK